MAADLSTAKLIARLMEVYGADGHEELARRLDVPLRTLQRWAANAAGPEFSRTIDLLERAGWLSISEDGLESGETGSLRPASIEEAAADLLLGQAEILERLDELAGARGARTTAAPRKKVASRRKGR